MFSIAFWLGGFGQQLDSDTDAHINITARAAADATAEGDVGAAGKKQQQAKHKWVAHYFGRKHKKASI